MKEFLAEAYIKVGKSALADEQLSLAKGTAKEIAPDSDIMTEILRRQAELDFLQGDLQKARYGAVKCIRLCRKISDKYEMGASLRVLGEIYERQGLASKAVGAFEKSINVLKSISESYELMRSCIAYAEFLVDSKSTDAEIYLLEAKQLSKKLEIDYFMAKIMLLSARFAYNKNDHMTARSYLRRAEES